MKWNDLRNAALAAFCDNLLSNVRRGNSPEQLPPLLLYSKKETISKNDIFQMELWYEDFENYGIKWEELFSILLDADYKYDKKEELVYRKINMERWERDLIVEFKFRYRKVKDWYAEMEMDAREAERLVETTDYWFERDYGPIDL